MLAFRDIIGLSPHFSFNFLSFISLAVALFNLYLLGYIAGQRKKDALSRSFFWFILFIFLMMVTDFLIRLPLPEPFSPPFIRTGMILFLLSTLFYLRICYFLTDQPLDGVFRAFVVWIAGSSAASFFLPSPVLLQDITLSIRYDIFLPLYAAVFAPTLFGVFLCCRRLLSSPELRKKKQILLFILGSASATLFMILLILTNLFLLRSPLATYAFPCSILIQSLFLYRAVSRHYFLSFERNELEKMTSGLFRNIREGIILIDSEGQILQINESARLTLNLPSSPTPLELTRRIPGYRPDRIYHFERMLLPGQDNRERVVLLSQEPIREQDEFYGYLLLIRDITEQNALEEELHRTRQVESLGWLAGGIAHDFNNFLTGVMTSFSIIRMEKLTPVGRDIVEASEKASLRAADLVQQLMTFSRGDAPIRENLPFRQLIEETASFVLRGTDCSLTIDCPATLPPVSADKKLISRVFHNLIVNSLQASPRNTRLTVTARNVTVIGDSSLPISPGRYIHVVFRDNGPGIPPEHIKRVFDPYFSTKDSGKGLGLTIVHSVIQRHGGHIKARNAPEGGAVFEFYLPAGSVLPDRTEDADDENLAVPPSRILIMEDMKDVQTPLRVLLEKSGHTISTAEEGHTALKLFSDALEEGRPFHAVIIDIMIPGGMGGIELNERIKKDSPGTRTILYSGHTDAELPDSSRFDAFLTKPFTHSCLNKTLYELLSPSASLARK